MYKHLHDGIITKQAWNRENIKITNNITPFVLVFCDLHNIQTEIW